MKCDTVQHDILSLPDPRRIPDSLREHVVSCAACRTWAEQAGRLESLLERLPVPVSSPETKAAFLDRIARSPELAEPVAASAFQAWLQRNATLVGGLAAALLLAVGAWSLVGKKGTKPELAETTPKDPFLEKLVQRDVALAGATTHARKLRILGELADDLSTEARGLARIANPDELKDVARWFDRVVERGVIRQAEQTPPNAMTPAERKEEFTALARKLGTVADEVKKASAEVPPDAKPILERIGDSARNGQKKLEILAD
jgi:hypothetical protein